MLRYFFLIKVLPASLISVFFIKSVPINDTAAILFSSGSEGQPKGVELTHSNILANIKQMANVCNIEDTDTIMSILPLFHAFGLTVTMFMPLIEGSSFVCQPDPTDALAIGKLIYRYQATMIFASSTFFGLYARSKEIASVDVWQFAFGYRWR